MGNITKYFEEGELDQSTKTELAQVAGAINEMAGLITAWNDLFHAYPVHTLHQFNRRTR